MTVTEEEIKESLRSFVQSHNMPIEGAAAVAIASHKKMSDAFRGKKAVVVLCGGNIDPDILKSVL